MMNRKEIIFRCFAVSISTLLFVTGLWMLNSILLPKWHDSEAFEPTTDIITGFYAEPENSIDILFLGSSHVFCGINPLSIYDETGICSYDLATGIQRTWVSYYYLLEALKTQSPSVVVLDTHTLFLDSQNEESRNRMALDYLKNSDVKWSAIHVSMQPGESLLSYAFPAIRFHERIMDLTKEDFFWPLQKNRHNRFHGYRYEYMNKITQVSFMSYDEHSEEEALDWNDTCKSRYYLNMIVKECADRNIQLVLVTVPVTMSWDVNRRLAVINYADENDIDYFDFVPEVDEINLSSATDFYDSTHLNIYGADKFSRYLAKILLEQYFQGKMPLLDAKQKEQWDWDYMLYWETFQEERRLIGSMCEYSDRS